MRIARSQEIAMPLRARNDRGERGLVFLYGPDSYLRCKGRKKPPETSGGFEIRDYSVTVRMTPMGVCWLSWPRGLSLRILTYRSRSMLGSEVPRIWPSRSLMSTMMTR